MSKATCASCKFFEAQPDIPVAGVPSNSGIVGGLCAVDPPTMHMVPVPIAPKSVFDVRPDGAQQMALTPMPIERYTMNTRLACGRHQPKQSH